MVDNKKRAFVIGWPISHSLSPILHTYWLNEYKINGSYEKFSVTPDDLGKFLAELSNEGYVGGNVTIPHKETVFEKLKFHDQTASDLEAVNTLWFEKGQLYGGNTDGYGFTENLNDHSKTWQNSTCAMIIGAGGAARAISLALINAGIPKIIIANRTLARAQQLAAAMGAKCIPCTMQEIPNFLPKTQLLINTTSLGMINQPPLEIDLSLLPGSAFVTDIVYNPLQTPLLQQASSLGLENIDGIGMLLHQAVPGFEKWFGARPSVTPQLRAHILDYIEMKKP